MNSIDEGVEGRISHQGDTRQVPGVRIDEVNLDVAADDEERVVGPVGRAGR